MKKLQKPPLWAALVLFHPTLSLYSRTIMADELAGLFLVIAALGYLSNKWRGLLTGMAISCAAITKYYMIIVFIPAGIALFFSTEKQNKIRETGYLILSAIIAVALVVTFNLVSFGSINYPQGYNKITEIFSINYITGNISYYIPALAVVWPGMIVAPIFDKSKLRLLSVPTIFTVFCFFLIYYFHDKGTNWFETSVTGQRLIQPILPLWILSYIFVIDKIFVKYVRNTKICSSIFYMVCALLLTMQVFLFSKHQYHLSEMHNIKQEINSIIPSGSLVIVNSSVNKLFGVIAENDHSYRLHIFSYNDILLDHSVVLQKETYPWYLAIYTRRDSDTPLQKIKHYEQKYSVEKIPTNNRSLIIMRGICKEDCMK
ncbi:MAG: hypothetical protein AAB116_13155 [Candidatus Poribacteria bacterium]